MIAWCLFSVLFVWWSIGVAITINNNDFHQFVSDNVPGWDVLPSGVKRFAFIFSFVLMFPYVLLTPIDAIRYWIRVQIIKRIIKARLRGLSKAIAKRTDDKDIQNVLNELIKKADNIK